MNQQGNAAAPKVNWILGCICTSITSRDKRCDHPTWSNVERRHGEIGKGAKDSHEHHQMTGESLLCEKIEGVRLCPLEKIQGRPHHSAPGQPQREQEFSLHKKPHRQDKGQQLKVALEEVSSRHKRNFYNENNQCLEQPPQGHGRNSTTGVLQDRTEQSAK